MAVPDTRFRTQYQQLRTDIANANTLAEFQACITEAQTLRDNIITFVTGLPAGAQRDAWKSLRSNVFHCRNHITNLRNSIQDNDLTQNRPAMKQKILRILDNIEIDDVGDPTQYVLPTGA